MQHLYASSLSVFQSYDCTVFIISQLLRVLNVYLYIIIRKKNVFAGSLPKTSKTYLRRLRNTSLRRLTDVFARLLQDIFRKTSCNYVLKTSRKRKKCYTEDIFSTSSPRQMFAGNIRLILSFSTK